jgi:nucleotide-binding universal stress UspA family protein
MRSGTAVDKAKLAKMLPMKTSLSRIVCAIDFSEPSRHAAMAAAAMAARVDATLVLVHALDLGPAFLIPAKRRRILFGVAEAQLDTEAHRLRMHGATVESMILESGWAVEAILEFIRAEPPAFLVLASGRKSALDRWTLGSVSDAVAQSAPCPVLVVRDPTSLIAWAHGHVRLKILAALDHESCSENALRWIASLQAIGPCEVTACHVDLDSSAPTEKGVVLSGRQSSEGLESSQRDFRPRLDGQTGIKEVRVVIEPTAGTLAETLIEVASRFRADLIVAGTHQRHQLTRLWLGSVSRTLMHDAPMSVACVAATALADWPLMPDTPAEERAATTSNGRLAECSL